MEYTLKEDGYTGKGKIKYTISKSNCWECTHPKSKAGAGQYLSITRNGKRDYIHRYIYKLYYGNIQENLVIMHLCDNTHCINPEHLQEGTHKDNAEDRDKKGRAIQSEETRKLRSKLWSGKNNPMTKDIEIYKQAKQMLDSNIKVKDISDKLKLNQETIYQIKRGTHWSTK